MIRISSFHYKQGIESRNRFMEMLQGALNIALKGVEIREVTSFSWQGFQIIKYPGLKDRQFFCEIYQGAWHILTFHEYYKMTEHPFEMKFDLLLHGFYH